MKKIEKDGILYCIYDDLNSLSDKSESKWYSKSSEAIQVCRMNYNKGKEFKAHKHILRPRLNNYTQEAIIVLKGKISATIYDKNDTIIAVIKLKENNIGIFFTGGHGFEVLSDNTVFYEIKNGEFTRVEEDKKYIEE